MSFALPWRAYLDKKVVHFQYFLSGDAFAPLWFLYRRPRRVSLTNWPREPRCRL